MTPIQNNPPLLLLLLPLLLRLPPPLVASSDCLRACGPTTVPYPFGFSAGCKIRLTCTPGNNTIKIGGFSIRNITSDRLLLDVPPSCDRPIKSTSDFFGPNFSLTRKNSLLLRNCSSSNSTKTCSISADLISNNPNFKKCELKDDDNVSCFATATAGGGTGDFLSADQVAGASSCGFLFTAATYVSDAEDLTSIVLSEAELGWWVNGTCQCSDNANCTRLTSPVTGGPAFRCKCGDGYEGDGFAGGGGAVGCVKG